MRPFSALQASRTAGIREQNASFSSPCPPPHKPSSRLPPPSLPPPPSLRLPRNEPRRESRREATDNGSKALLKQDELLFSYVLYMQASMVEKSELCLRLNRRPMHQHRSKTSLHVAVFLPRHTTTVNPRQTIKTTTQSAGKADAFIQSDFQERALQKCIGH